MDSFKRHHQIPAVVSFHLYEYMNKRQKKKKLKNEAWNEDYQAYLRHQRELERELGFNGEGYRDRTAEAAIRSVMREQGYR